MTMQRKLAEQELVDWIATNRRWLLSHVQQHSREMLRTDAEDILHDALIRVLPRVEEVEHKRAYFLVTLRRTALRKLDKHHRDRLLIDELQSHSVDAEHTSTHIQQTALLCARMDVLADTEHRILQMRLDGETETDIAAGLGLSAATVCRMFRSAVAQLEFQPVENVQIQLNGLSRSTPSELAVVHATEANSIELRGELFWFFAHICSHAYHNPTRFLELNSLLSFGSTCNALLKRVASEFEQNAPGVWDKIVERRTGNEVRLRVLRKNMSVAPGRSARLTHLFDDACGSRVLHAHCR